MFASSRDDARSPSRADRKVLRLKAKWEFNAEMKMKPLLIAIIAIVGLTFVSPTFAGMISKTGTVKSVTSELITLTIGKDTWEIKRTTNTSVTSGKLQVGATVTITCEEVDAHKQENPPS